MAREKNNIDNKQRVTSQSYTEGTAPASEGLADTSLKTYAVLFQNLGLDKDTLLKSFTSLELKNMLNELPQVFHDEHIQKIITRFEENNGESYAAVQSDIDEQIKGIAAFLKGREETLHELPELPREALKQLLALRRSASVEEVMQIQEKILHSLRQRYGDFDEGNLVLFLVKYLL
ncbi:MAG: hypothetical protein WCQ99_09430 [Pseudomonadota bacterium]